MKNLNRKAKQISLLEEEKTYRPNKLNELSGDEWLYFTRSVMPTSYPPEYGHNLRKKHGPNKPPRLMKEIIEFFTKLGEIVLDPFAGVGGTLLGASLCGRKCFGIEINREWINIYYKVCEKEGIEKQEMIEGDCLEKLDELKERYGKGYFNFIATDPPYNLSFERTMCDGRYKNWKNRATLYCHDFSDNPRDFANLPSYEHYLNAMKNAFERMHCLLADRKYMVLIVRDAYQHSRYILTGYDLAKCAEKTGFVLKGDKIWYQGGAKLRPYGYPNSFVPNIIHQHILIFRKT